MTYEDESRIAVALSHVPADDRDVWLRMAMAVKSELGDSGFDLWDDWSQGSDRYRAADARATWRSIAAHGGVSLGTLFYLARQHGWSGSTKYTPRPDREPVEPVTTAKRWSTRAEKIWSASVTLTGSCVASLYLKNRGCVLPPADGDIRLLQTDKWPVMVARVTDAITCELLTLHMTALAPDGSGKAPVETQKKLLKGHVKQGGCIRLWPDDAVTHGLAIAEGIENALAAADVQTPVWSAIDTGNLGAFPVLLGIECLTVFVDDDPAGKKAAHAVITRWRDAGKETHALLSITGGDAADAIGGAVHG